MSKEIDISSKQYYYDRMSNFLNQSVGIRDRVDFLVDLLNNIDNIYSYTLESLDITNSKCTGVYLEDLGAMFGLTNKPTVEYYTIDTSKWTYTDSGTKKQLSLSDSEFKIYIKTQIIRNHFKGTYEEINKLYGSDSITGLNLFYRQHLSGDETSGYNYDSLSVDVLLQNIEKYSDNLRQLFLNGLLTIESMGIVYHYGLVKGVLNSNVYDDASYDVGYYEVSIL